MRRTTLPGPGWLVGVLIAAVLVGGMATLLTDEHSPARPFGPPVAVETTINEVVVLPESQAEVSGHIDGFIADDAVGEPLTLPIEVPRGGGATIEGAIVDGERSAIVWDGGRTLRLSGSGVIDLGPTHVEMGMGATYWTIDGLRLLTPGEYRIDTPVAVGSGGLARPRDSVVFTADDDTTIDTQGGGLVGRGLPVHLEGPGTFRADGQFRIRTRDGTVDATHLEFGPGPFVVDVATDGTFTAVFNGRLVSSKT